VIIDAVVIVDTFEMATTIWAPGARVVCFGQDYRAEAKIKPNDIVRYQRKILGHTLDMLRISLMQLS